MKVKEDCIFCKIVAGEAPSFKVFENDKVLAFMDVMPASPGHTLIVTKNHADNVLESDPEDIAEVGRVSVMIANAVKAATGADGIGVHQLNGAAAGQTVFHYHMHIIPQMAGSSVQIHSREMGDMAEIEAMAEKIKAELVL